MTQAWMKREAATCLISSDTGKTAQVRPIDPTFWDDDGPIEIMSYFATHDAYLRTQIATDQVVYHYTTLQGLQGIVREGALWASDARLLNDRSEIRYALEQMRERIAAKLGHGFPQQPIDAVFRPGRVWQFVSCFSRARDQLSQWRAYGKNVGVAIGFDRAHLACAVESRGGHSSECRYFSQTEFSALDEELDQIADGLRTPGAINDNGGLIDMVLQERLTRRAARVASSIKHPTFAEEREVRLVVAQHEAGDAIEFRSNTEALIPFVKINIDSRELKSQRPKFANHLGMMEVIVWPSSADDQILDAIDMLMGDAGRVLVTRSASPYRT